jgi:hypothetical protein
LSMIFNIGRIPFKFHQGILFDTIDDIFDNLFQPARRQETFTPLESPAEGVEAGFSLPARSRFGEGRSPKNGEAEVFTTHG